MWINLIHTALQNLSLWQSICLTCNNEHWKTNSTVRCKLSYLQLLAERRGSTRFHSYRDWSISPCTKPRYPCSPQWRHPQDEGPGDWGPAWSGVLRTWWSQAQEYCLQNISINIPKQGQENITGTVNVKITIIINVLHIHVISFESHVCKHDIFVKVYNVTYIPVLLILSSLIKF